MRGRKLMAIVKLNLVIQKEEIDNPRMRGRKPESARDGGFNLLKKLIIPG